MQSYVYGHNSKSRRQEPICFDKCLDRVMPYQMAYRHASEKLRRKGSRFNGLKWRKYKMSDSRRLSIDLLKCKGSWKSHFKITLPKTRFADALLKYLNVILLSNWKGTYAYHSLTDWHVLKRGRSRRNCQIYTESLLGSVSVMVHLFWQVR